MFGRIRKYLAGKRTIIPPSDQLRDDLRPTEDWAVGDLAECTANGQWVHIFNPGIASNGPQNEERLIVREVVMIGGFLSLRFSQYPGSYCARYFRKITPRADAAERSDASFRDLVRRKTRPATRPKSLPAKREKETA